MVDDQVFGPLGEKRPTKKTEENANRWTRTGVGNYPNVTIRPSGPTAAFMIMHTVGAGGSLPSPTNDTENSYRKLWVHEIVFGWSIDYKQSQTVFGKSFYPRHLQISNVIVKGQTASQDHYDQIVKDVLNFQKNSVIAESSTSDYGFDIVRFEIPEAKYSTQNWKRLPYQNSRTKQMIDADDDGVIYRYDRIWFDGYPISIKAGHRKGVYNPEFELTFAVLSYKNDMSIVDLTNAKFIKAEENLIKSIDPNFDGLEATSPAAQSGYNAIPGGPGGHPIGGPNG
jgi:hypothetical protein